MHVVFEQSASGHEASILQRSEEFRHLDAGGFHSQLPSQIFKVRLAAAVDSSASLLTEDDCLDENTRETLLTNRRQKMNQSNLNHADL
jgi:hypothetical protein